MMVDSTRRRNRCRGTNVSIHDLPQRSMVNLQKEIVSGWLEDAGICAHTSMAIGSNTQSFLVIPKKHEKRLPSVAFVFCFKTKCWLGPKEPANHHVHSSNSNVNHPLWGNKITQFICVILILHAQILV